MCPIWHKRYIVLSSLPQPAAAVHSHLSMLLDRGSRLIVAETDAGGGCAAFAKRGRRSCFPTSSRVTFSFREQRIEIGDGNSTWKENQKQNGAVSRKNRDKRATDKSEMENGEFNLGRGLFTRAARRRCETRRREGSSDLRCGRGPRLPPPPSRQEW